jgi:phosphate transport system substrate-binding protein
MAIRCRLMLVCVTIALAGCSGAPSALPPASPPPAATPPPPSAAPTSADAGGAILPEGSADWALISGMIVIDGSSTVFPITEAAALEFAAVAPAVQVQLGVSGTGGGFAKFCAGETQISDASRPIKQSEAAQCAANGIGFIELPVAFDGLSVVVHRQNSWADCLTVAELNKIWEPAAEGALMRWGQVREGWPDQPLSLYGAGRDSGTFDYFTSAIVGQEGVARSDFTASEDDYLLAQDIAADPNSLGFFGYAYYSQYQDQLKLLAVDGGAGCVAPSDATIADGSYQPLARPIFIYVRADALDQPAVSAFVSYYIANAARLVKQVRYTPLPARAYALVAARLEQQSLGSVFSGGSQVGLSIEELLTLEGNKP